MVTFSCHWNWWVAPCNNVQFSRRFPCRCDCECALSYEQMRQEFIFVLSSKGNSRKKSQGPTPNLTQHPQHPTPNRPVNKQQNFHKISKTILNLGLTAYFLPVFQHKLPTSTGEFTGFLNHQDDPGPMRRPSSSSTSLHVVEARPQVYDVALADDTWRANVRIYGLEVSEISPMDVGKVLLDTEYMYMYIYIYMCIIYPRQN